MAIEICMGSSCFARGAGAFPAVVREVLAGRDPALVEVVGCRCHDACAKGPSVRIDGQHHRVADGDALRALLLAHLPADDARSAR